MKKNLFLITEEEKNRILGMHMKATKSQYLSEQAAPVTTNTTTVAPATTTNTTAAPTATAPAAPTAAAPESQIMTSNDRDYAYKKEGDNYFFKLLPSPASPKAQAYKKQGKFADWTAATGGAKDAIAKLNFKPETMQTLSAKDVKVEPKAPQTLSTTAQTAAAAKP
jgi:hypothetical protein